MSRTCTDWAWKQDIKPATLKLTLLALSDRAEDIGYECYPSIDRVALDTGLNKKTVQQNIIKLIEMGFVSDTGNRRGKLQRVRILKLHPNVPKNGTFNVPENGVDNVPENGLQNQSLNQSKESVVDTSANALAHQIIDLWNEIKNTQGTMWQGVDTRTKKRLTLTNKRIKLVRERLKANGSHTDDSAVRQWFMDFLIAMSSDPFYSGKQNNYRLEYGQFMAEDYFVKTIERINGE